jgi:sulfatase maturation enzyme AslB (radical SAM superfamily)
MSKQTQLTEPTDFGEEQYPHALVNVTNVCNLDCRHCFVFRADNPQSPRDKMNDATMLHQLEILRDKHGIRSMLFMGGEPMIRKNMVIKAIKLFPESAIVTNGTYGIPSIPGHLVTVSLDGPPDLNDLVRGKGVFAKVKEAVFARDANDGTTVMLQMAVTRENAQGLEKFMAEVSEWPISGVAFSFYVPVMNDETGLDWKDLKERDKVLDRVIALKKKYPRIIKSHIPTLEMMKSDQAIKYTGEHGENCIIRRDTLPLYMGDGGQFEKPFCCYGNDVDCTRCGAYAVFNRAYLASQGRGNAARYGRDGAANIDTIVEKAAE